MKKRILAIALASTLTLGACGAMNAPVQPVPVQVDQNIISTFAALDTALIALQFVPTIPALVVTEAKATEAALKAAYAAYQANPTATEYQASLTAAITAGMTFLASQTAAMHAPAITKALTLKQMDAVQSVK